MYIHTTLLRLFIVATLFAFSFGTASAQEVTTTSETTNIEALTAQIAELLEVVASLQAQLTSSISGNTPTNTTSFTFNTNLTVGSENEDVRQLQIVLNANPQTKVAQTGAGSPGNETTYFGPRTAQAVIAFQNLHKADILTPVGLTSGTGYVGPSTRKLLNGTNNSTIITNTSNSGSGNLGQNNVPEATMPNVEDDITVDTTTNTGTLTQYEIADTFAVGAFSSYVSEPGRSVTIEGIGLTKNTTIDFNGTKVTGTPSTDGTSLVITVPYVDRGVYKLKVSDSGTNSIRDIDFVVKNTGAESPVIYSISPSIGAYGSEVTVYGKNFTKTNNMVDLGFGNLMSASSIDGKKLVIKMSPNADLGRKARDARNEWPLVVHILNANGITEENGLFIIRN